MNAVGQEGAAFKQCPVCGAKCFADMDVCYNCLHSFAADEQDGQMAGAPAQPSEARYPQVAQTHAKAPSFGVLGASCEGDEAQSTEVSVPEKPFGAGLHAWGPAPQDQIAGTVESAVSDQAAPHLAPAKIAVSSGAGKEVLRFQPSQYVEIVINVQPA